MVFGEVDSVLIRYCRSIVWNTLVWGQDLGLGLSHRSVDHFHMQTPVPDLKCLARYGAVAH